MESLCFVLAQSENPKHWYNVVTDRPNAPLGAEGKLATPEQMGAIFPMTIFEQEISSERRMPVPQEVCEICQLWRPSPLVSRLFNEGVLEVVAVPQWAIIDAGLMFGHAEGIITAPESNHAICSAIDEALRGKEVGEAKTILFNLKGHGRFDIASNDRYFAGELEDFDCPEEAIAQSVQHLPKFG